VGDREQEEEGALEADIKKNKKAFYLSFFLTGNG
jgi:hypothetical protein